MRIDPAEGLAGVPMLRVRDLMRRVRGRSFEVAETRNVAAGLQAWIDDARRLREALRALEDASAAAVEADRGC